MPGSSLDDAEAALLAYARREIDAVRAVTRICDFVVKRVGHKVQCALVARDGSAEEVFVGAVDNVAAAMFCKAVAHAATRRSLFTRENGDRALDGSSDTAVDWIAVEPLVTRNKTYLGALAVMGPRAAREEVLVALPRAALLCSDVAFELLCPAVLGNAVHKFSNALSILAANVEYMTSTIESADGSVSPEERTQLMVSAGHAADGAKALVSAASELRSALPFGTPTVSSGRVSGH